METIEIEQGALHSGEWLETDGLGGFAMGTVSGIPTRRYHALLTAAMTPPTGRLTLVNAVEVTATVGGKNYALSSFRFKPDLVHPDGCTRLIRFTPTPWPTWIYALPGGIEICAELCMPKDASLTVLSWSAVGTKKPVRLTVRPLLSGRDCHWAHRWNNEFCFNARTVNDTRHYFKPYAQLPELLTVSNGKFVPDPIWYYDFIYSEECARGFEGIEDLASPGRFEFELGGQRAALMLGLSERAESFVSPAEAPEESALRIMKAERDRRAAFPSPSSRAADQFIVRRGAGLTIVAGYPWFTDWGRDTFISMRGLCISNGRLNDATQILLQWAKMESAGMMPNAFFDGTDPFYNSVDSALWYVTAVHDLRQALIEAKTVLPPEKDNELLTAVEHILTHYSEGTRYGIHADSDGLLACGEHGVQLTWMDAKVNGYVVTPRTGKPVEIQALWLNALKIGSLLPLSTSARWLALFEQGVSSFGERFWNRSRRCLYDVVDVDHQSGTFDARIRPNQILAVGGLPFPILDEARSREVVTVVEHALITPMGLRTLAPGERGYAARCEGTIERRDFAYHQGTVWPWLSGAFIDAWVRVRGGTPEAKAEARRRFVEPLKARLDPAAGGHIPEIADAEPPYTRRGAPCQAWSLGELIRAEKITL